MADEDPDEGEHAFLRRLGRRLSSPLPSSSDGKDGIGVEIGIGDDAAVFRTGANPVAATTDALIEGTHFRWDWLDPEELGRRAIAVNLSDLAAMGARPRFVLAAVATPSSVSRDRLDAILDGCAGAAREAGAALIGGNLSSAREFSITITAFGDIPGPCLRRSGALPGDDLIVTGTLGDAASAVSDWTRGLEPAAAQRARWIAPQARIAAGLILAESGAHAAIDLSDGLLADLGHLCAASEVGALVENERLPRSPEVARADRAGASFAAGGGEDYELLVACPPGVTARLDELAARAGVALSVIGRITDRPGEVALVDAAGTPMAEVIGFDHFSAESRNTV